MRDQLPPPADGYLRIRIGYVLHVMQVAGAETLVAETIRRLGRAIDPVIFCLDDVGALGEIMRSEGTEVLAMGRRAGVDFRVVWRLARHVRSRHLDVLHAHQYTPFFYGALAAKLAGVGTRVILTEHGRHYPDVVSARRRLVNRLVLSRFADRITAVCAFSASGLSESDGFPLDRIEVIRNGVDLDRYQRPRDRQTLRRALGLHAARRYVATVARFHPVKDHHTLLHAFAQVCSIIDDVDLLLVGDGPLRGELQRLAQTLGIGERVQFLGVRADVPDILAAVDLFALSSVSEAASITLLEAMAAGIPLVVTDVGGNPEIVRQGIDGLLTPSGDATAMATAMRRLLEDRTRAGRMGRQAAERVRVLYRIGGTVDQYRRVYQAVSAEHRRPR